MSTVYDISSARTRASAHSKPNASTAAAAHFNSHARTRGFTLAELLIVVAIIAVLVAISIPIFTAQLEKSREAVDLANLRSAYAAGRYQLMEENEAEAKTENSLETYVYDPSSGKLLTFLEANKEKDSNRFLCGKGTSTVGSKDHRHTITYNGGEIDSITNKQVLRGGNSGILYDPSDDVKNHAVIVTLYPPNKTVIAYFQ